MTKLAGIALAALALVVGAAAAAEEPPRHVVVVSLDTLRADRLGAYGYRRPTSPSFDAVAARGVRFDEAISQAISTPPSHASILTGKNPPNHGLRKLWGDALPPENETLAEILRAKGFSTAAFVSGLPLRRSIALDQGFDFYEDSFAEEKLKERTAGATNERVREWLAGWRGDRLFLWVHYFDPHMPYAAPPEFRERFGATMAPSQALGGVDARENPGKRPHPAAAQQMRNHYDAEIAYTDQQLGELFSMLEARGILQQAIIALVADHGEALGEYGYYFGHWDVLPQTARIPMVLAHPDGRWKGTAVEARVRSIDLLPTILTWLDLPLPAGIDGRDLTPLIEGAEEERRLAYTEQYEFKRVRGVYYGPWLLHEKRAKKSPDETEARALYDTARDPDIGADLSARHRELADRLASELARTESPERAQQATPIEVPDDVADQLRALGYTED